MRRYYNHAFERFMGDRKRPSVSDLKRPYGNLSSSDKLNNYLNSTRQIGHTRTLKEALKNVETPFYLVSINMKHATEICQEIKNPNAMPITSDLLGGKFPNVPVIMDNSAYMRMCELYDRKLMDYYYECVGLIEDVQKYCDKEIEFIEDKMEKQSTISWRLKMELIEDKKKISHYKERINEEKEKKAYYKQSKQDFLNGLTLFQRIFKKFD